MKNYLSVTLALATAALAACSDDAKTDAQFQQDVITGMHDSISADLGNLVTAASKLQAAAPDHAWDPVADKPAIDAMKAAWLDCRVAYEHVEGATAPIFPDSDTSMDARWDDFMALLPEGDTYLFDDVGVTGMHAIERILYSDMIRDSVMQFEMSCCGSTFVAAAFPKTAQEAMDFKTRLAQKLIADATDLKNNWVPAKIDLSFAFPGLVSLMNEQKEKVNLAATGAEESRYANTTLFDLRNNLQGTKNIYAIFQPWVQSKPAGKDPDMKIEAKFSTLQNLYDMDMGNDLPPVPSDWSGDMPTAANLATPFGTLWGAVHADVDPSADGSVVFEMNKIAVLLGFPQFSEQP